MNLFRRIADRIGILPIQPIVKSAADRQRATQDREKEEVLRLSNEAARQKYEEIFREYKITDTEHLKLLALRTNNEFRALMKSPALNRDEKAWVLRMRRQRDLARKIFIDTGEISRKIYEALEGDSVTPPEPGEELDLLC